MRSCVSGCARCWSAGQAALALERARAQEEREQLAVLGDRERVARELHDVVIQRLFAAGMQLQVATSMAAKPDVRKRIDTVVDDLDATIRDIRSAIFELRQSQGSLRGEIRSTVEQARPALGFRPDLRVDGPVDTVVPEPVRPALLAVLREALSNVARHAEAGAVSVVVSVESGELALTVRDDGQGISAKPGAGHGVRNMRTRADELGGVCTLAPAEPSGTVLTWRVPISSC